MISEDLDLFLADFGLPVTAGSVSGTGILDMPTQVVADGMLLSTDYKLTVRTADFGGLLYGDAITVEGVNYQVREAMKLDDGALTELYLTKLAPDVVAPGGQPREWTLGDLSDVDVTDAQDGDVLVRENGQWVDGQDDNGIAVGVALS